MAHELSDDRSNSGRISIEAEGKAMATIDTTNNPHWTSQSITDFTYRIASDFVAQIETNNEMKGTTQAELATRLDRTPGRVSQLFNPGNITLSSAIRLGHASGMKVALVAYDDNDPHNQNGPINSEIFHRCWRAMGCPQNFFELAESANLSNTLAFQGWVHEAVTSGEMLQGLSPSRSATTHGPMAVN
jgi:hypothetical protein